VQGEAFGKPVLVAAAATAGEPDGATPGNATGVFFFDRGSVSREVGHEFV
jgi:hypothetical protein